MFTSKLITWQSILEHWVYLKWSKTFLRSPILLLIDYRLLVVLDWTRQLRLDHAGLVWNLTPNLVARIFSVCGYRRVFIRGHTVKIVLRDRKRFENDYICQIMIEIIEVKVYRIKIIVRSFGSSKNTKLEDGPYCTISGNEPSSVTLYKTGSESQTFCCNFKNLHLCSLNQRLKFPKEPKNENTVKKMILNI